VQQKATTYSFHPSFAHWAAMLASLKQRTGKDIHEWMAALELAHAATTAEIREFLKTQNLGASSIGLIVDHAGGKSPDSYDPDAFVAQLFKGPKAALGPLYETVLHFALELGSDVKACPCATIVPLYRNHVFAQLKPSTKSRLDLGLALGRLQLAQPKTGHLIDTGGLSKKDRITHRLELGRPTDFNDFAKDWLRRAYDADAADKADKLVSRSNTL
jgi:hypothetical protein